MGGRPHKHPSITCYKHHKCRCDGCTRINAETRDRERKRRQEFKSVPRPLGEEELARLRRAVGLE